MVLSILFTVIVTITANSTTWQPFPISINASPDPVLTLTIAECLRKPSRPWHAPAVLRFMSAQATGSAHKLKNERTKTDSRENCCGPQHPTRMCRAWMPADCVCCRWQQRAGDSGATATAGHEPPWVADTREPAQWSRGLIDKSTTRHAHFRKQKVHYRAHNSPPPVPIPSDINPVQPTFRRTS